MSDTLDRLVAEIRACRVCAPVLAHPPRPVLHVAESARLLIISQAPGVRVHSSGVSFDDRSGDRLRDWMGVDRATFYDSSRIAIMASGFCYPGADRKGGDLPPRPECAPLWHPRLLRLMPNIGLTLLVGSYAQRRYLGLKSGTSTGDVVRRWPLYLPRWFVLPHPSWRNTGWLKRNSWFEAETLPALRVLVAALVSAADTPPHPHRSTPISSDS